jgi:membrane complex biogenesis BtpA family protein
MFDLNRCAFVGMVHVPPLPGSPNYGGDMQAILDSVKHDAEALVAGGCDALLVENMHDLPYLKGAVGPEVVAAMTLATASAVSFGIPVGVQVLAAANQEALGVAMAAGAVFIRAEAFAYGHVADEGYLDACAGPLLRARVAMGARNVAIWADIKKKHAAHALTGDLSIADVAKGSAFCGADALIVTGMSTGEAAQINDVQAARAANLPVAVGSGITAENTPAFAAHADALIVGTFLKRDGDWRAPVDVDRVRAVAAAVAGG